MYFIHENNGEGQDLIIININGVIRKKGFGERNGGGGREVWWRRR